MDEHDWLAERFEEHRTRQLASRTRRRVHGAGTGPDADLTRRREIVDAFLAASRGGDLNALLALLDPDVVLRADPAAVRAGASSELRGAAAVAETFSGRARAARPALVDGVAGAVWAQGGRARVVFASHRSRTARSSQSTYSPTPSASAASTSRSSTTDEPPSGDNPSRG